MVTALMALRVHEWRLSKMADEKYVEISSKVLKAEATVKKAIDQFESELANIFSEVSKEDMAKWLQTAEYDDKISSLVLDKAIDGWRASHSEEFRNVSMSEALIVLATLKMLLD